MAVRIYDIAKKLGMESKQVLAFAKELGIKEAKVPSSSLDKITAEFIEEKLEPFRPAKPAPGIEAPAPVVLITAPEPEPPPKPTTGQMVGRIDLSKFGVRREERPTPAGAPTPTPADPRLALPANSQVITMKPPIVIRDLAEQMRRKPFQLIADLMQMGIYANVNQAVDETVAIKLCAKHGFWFQGSRSAKMEAIAATGLNPGASIPPQSPAKVSVPSSALPPDPKTTISKPLKTGIHSEPSTCRKITTIIESMAVGWSYPRLWGQEIQGATTVVLEEPYLELPFQWQNLYDFCDMVLCLGSAKRIELHTLPLRDGDKNRKGDPLTLSQKKERLNTLKELLLLRGS